MAEPRERANAPAPVEWVCVAKLFEKDKFSGHELRRISPDGESLMEPGSIFGTRKLQVHVGGVFKIDTIFKEDDGISIVPSTAEWVRTWEDKAAVAAWQTVSRAAETAARAYKMAKSEKGVNHMLAVLDPLRKAYNATDHIGRLAIELQVLAYLRSRSGYNALNV